MRQPEVSKQKDKWRKRVSDEFGAKVKVVIAKVKVVIQSFADSGYSKLLCAGAIGITTQTLLRYCRENDIKFPDRIDLRDECKPKPGKRGYTNNPYGRAGKPKGENQCPIQTTK
jgi:hypothetical protein